MKKEAYEELKKLDYQEYLFIESEIQENYIPSGKVKLADAVSTGLYFIGFGIGLTILQSMFVLANSGKRTYTWNWLIALLGFNPFFLCYIGEQSRYKRYYKKTIAEKQEPEHLKDYLRRTEKIATFDDKFYREFKRTRLFSVPCLKDIKYKPIGFISGSTVKSKNAISDIGAGVKSIKGGEIKKYTYLMKETRNKAINDLINNAYLEYDNFDAIIGVELNTAQIANGASEIMAVGTVIKYTK